MSRSEIMIALLLVVFGLCAMINGIFAVIKNYDLEEIAIRLLVTGGFTATGYGLILLFNL